MIRDPSFIYLVTILPPILIGLIIWKSDKFPEPGKFLLASFLLGVSIYLPLDFLIYLTRDHFAPLIGLDIKNEPLKIISFVIDLKVSIGPDLKYSKDKTKIEITNNVNKENL